MNSLEFEDWWSKLRVKLLPGTIIPHWSAESASRMKALVGVFEVFEIDQEHIDLGWRTTIHKGPVALAQIIKGQPPASPGSPSTRHVKVPAHVFRKSLPRWNDYLAGEITRSQLEQLAAHQYSTYVISILYWLEKN